MSTGGGRRDEREKYFRSKYFLFHLSWCSLILNAGREQILMSRGLADLPVLVVANKMDLLSHPDTSDRGKLRQDIANKVRRNI